MGIVDRWTRFLITDDTSSDQRNKSIEKFEECFTEGLFFLRLVICFLLIIFTSFYVTTDLAIAGKAEEIKEEVKQGVKETKEEFKKVPGELKKAGKEIKKKSEEVRKNIETDVEQGKKNIQSITK